MTDISTYQVAVKRLTSENRELKRLIKDQRDAHAAQIRVLRAELNEGISPELTVLRRQLATWKRRALQAEQRLASTGRD